MRRARSYSPSAVTEGGEQGFWPSYADMMSAVALILFFLMLLSYISNLITGNDLQNTQEMLSDTQAQVAAYLSMKQPQYNRYERGLRDIPSDVLIALAKLYATSTDYILNLTEQQ